MPQAELIRHKVGSYLSHVYVHDGIKVPTLVQVFKYLDGGKIIVNDCWSGAEYEMTLEEIADWDLVK